MKCIKCNVDIENEYIYCPWCGEIINQNNLESNNQVNELLNNVESNSVEKVITSINNGGGEEEQFNGVIDQNINYNVGYKESNNIGIKGKSKTPILVAAILIVIVSAVALMGGYLFINSPKKVFTTYITRSTNLLYPYFDSDVISSDTASVDFNLKVNSDVKDDEIGPIMNLIKNITLSGKTQIDYKNKNFVLNFDSKYNSDELFKFNTYITNEKLYLDLIDVYDKKMSIDIEGINNFFELNNYKNDIKVLVNESVSAFNNSLKDEYFSLEKVKMKVNGKDTTINKITLLYNYKNAKALMNDVLNLLKSNDNFLDSYINIMKLKDEDITKISVINDINEFLREINEEDNSDLEGDYRVILYTQGFNKSFVGFAIENNVDEYGTDFSIINDKENIYTIKINNGHEEQEAVIEVNGDVYTLKIDEEYIKMEYGINFKTFDYSMKYTSDEFTMTGSLKTLEDGKKNLNILYTIEGNEIALDMTYKTKYNETITIPSLTPNVDIESISDEEGMNILNKLQEKQGFKNLMSEIDSLYSHMTPIEPVYKNCSSAFNCDCGDNNLTCTCSYIDQEGNVASDTIQCENPNYNLDNNYDYEF